MCEKKELVKKSLGIKKLYIPEELIITWYLSVLTFMLENMSSSLKKTFGKDIRDIRSHRGFTQEQVAQTLETSTRYYAGIERGERNLTLDSIETLADALNIEVKVIVTPKEDEN